MAPEPPEPARAPRPPRPWAEGALLVCAWLVLFWLTRLSPCPAGACGGAAGGPWISLALAVGSGWLAPGWALWRLLGLRAGGPLGAAAFASGLGLAWLVATAAVVLVLGGTMDHLVPAVSAQSGVFTLLFLARGARPTPDHAPAPGRAGPWPLALAALALAALLVVALGSRGFTFGGDEWFYLRGVRQFLDGRGWIFDFEPWELTLALLVRLAAVDLVVGYRVLLPPFLIGAAALSFLALAEAVLEDGAAACFAFVLQALFCLSDMNTRGGGAGMALLARVVEDKYAALLILVPLVQAAALRFFCHAPVAKPGAPHWGLAGGRARLLLAGAALAVAGEMVHPLAAVWLAVSLLVPALAWLRAHRPAGRTWWMVGAAALALAMLGLGLWLRSVRAAPYFHLQASNPPAQDVLLQASRGTLLVLSMEKGWYMGDPRLLVHPLLLAALAAGAWLAARRPHTPAALFLFGAAAVPLLLVFVPPLAVATGLLVSPWVMPRVLWVMPVSLLLAAPLRARLRGSAPAWTIALALAALALAPRIGTSVRALHQRNRVFITDGEREVQEFVASGPVIPGTLLAPRGISVRVPAWTSFARPLPGPDALRQGHAPPFADASARMLASREIGDEQGRLLDAMGVGRVVVRNGSVLERKMRRLPAAFFPLFRGQAYSVFWWRPEYWAAARAARDGGRQGPCTRTNPERILPRP